MNKKSRGKDVHHKDGNRLNIDSNNLEVLSCREHGCVSAKQHSYVKLNDILMKNEFDEYFGDVSFP